MNRANRVSRILVCLALSAMSLAPLAKGQKTPVAARITQRVNDTQTVRLPGNIHPWARTMPSQGAMTESQPLTRMLLLLQRSAEQEQALQKLMDEQQTKGSANYHAWLTPEQFGKQFGPADKDIQAITDWLSSQGLQVSSISPGRTVIEFNGTVAQVQSAFHTQMQRFRVEGREHFSNVTEPSIPEALAPVVRGVVALNNFPRFAQNHKVGQFTRDLSTGQLKPLFTFTDSNGTFYAMGPADFAKIYNIPSTATGQGQSIAIVGQSNIKLTDVRQFRSMFGLPANDPQIILNGPDPGLVDGDEGESDLDVQWAGAIAPLAKIKFVVSQSAYTSTSQVSSGVDLSALYAIDNNIAGVMSVSYGLCEAALGSAGNAYYNTLWQQAAAEGITVAVASGDNGSAGCDPINDPNAGSFGIAVSGFASTPYNVAVGGTDFNQWQNWTPYWNSTNAATTQLSAKGYIPEIPWDDSECAANFPNPCSAVDQYGADITAGSGGPSNCTTPSGTSCSGGYVKPTWQTGITGMPADGHRDLPDVSFFASNGWNGTFYVVCESDANPGGADCDLSSSPTSGTHNFSGVGGTSASAPAFAGVIALVNQATGGRQGNANFTLYALQKAQVTSGADCNSSDYTNPATPVPANCVFYDTTQGNNSVACTAGSTNCSNTGTTGYGILVTGSGSGASPAFKAGTGYDMATGLGTINVANLLSKWSTVNRTATTTSLSGPSATTLTSGDNFSITIGVAPSAASGAVSLTAIDHNNTILGSFGPFTLSGGSVSASTNLLPPNTAYLYATYAGDVTYASSTSANLAIVVNGANQTSKVTTSFVTFTTSGTPVLSTGAQSITYGDSYILRFDVTAASGSLSAPCTNSNTTYKPALPCPTGKIHILDNGSPLNDWPLAGTSTGTNVATLNNQGFAEDQPIQLAPGTHSITATYDGDGNYNAGTSNALSVTVAKAPTTMVVSSNYGTVPSGTTVTFTAVIHTTSNGAGPTGTVTFSNGSASLGTATCTPTSGAENTSTGLAYCTAVLATPVSAMLPPAPQPRVPLVPMVLLALSLVAFLAILRFRPQGRARALAYASLLAFVLLSVGLTGCGGGGGGGGGGNSKTLTINVSYPGDTIYNNTTGSTSIVVTTN